MARLARVVIANVPHHVTQRGNARRFLLDCDADRKVYLELLQEDAERCRVSVLGYCLMSNHVHLVLVPRKVEALARALKRTHGRYAENLGTRTWENLGENLGTENLGTDRPFPA